MNRRDFLSTTMAAGAAALAPAADRDAARAVVASAGAAIQTVRGPIRPADLGTTLVHEHVLVDFGGVASPGRYDADEVFRVVRPRLEELRQRGCRTFVDCTPAYLGRDPALLRRLSEATGLHIVTNTGYYGAANDVAIPKHAYAETAAQLAVRWTAEARGGIAGTGIRPGFVKVGVDPGPLSAIDRKLVEAAALCHLDTGLTLAIHTGDGEAALGILETLRSRGVSPAAWIWVHASNVKDRALLARLTDQGAWVELDNLSPATLAETVDTVADLHGRDRLDRVLVSQDAGWYHVGEPGGGEFRGYVFLFDAFVPALRARGLTDGDVRALLVLNPARALTPSRRPLGYRAGRPTTNSPTSGGSER
jgi:phosphotriesterase-related protein